MGGPALIRRFMAVCACLVVLVLVATGCSATSSSQQDQPYLVSYAQAAGLLNRLDPAEATEQIRDWALLGLAASLNLNQDQVVDNLYDSTPLRDPAFASLARQPTGPGRSLFDGTTLHILVPADDPHRARTIGLAIDQYRTDAGNDPPLVQVHTYRLRSAADRVELVAEQPAPTSTVRADTGWHEVRIDQQPALDNFAATTDHLSRMEIRGNEIWAGGWRWPDTSGGRITPDDVAVLQRGYQSSGALPGFSFDPEPVSNPGDIRAIVPGLAPAITNAITSGDWAGTGYSSPADLHDKALDELLPPQRANPPGLPNDRTQLWALVNLLEHKPAFNQARYDGGLAGTEVGMTAAYTDLIAKDWVTGVGTGVPSAAVPGFVPDPKAPTPQSLCASQPAEESGRLWFGQADNAFAFTANSLDIGAQATRLYSRANGVNGTEVQPSYSFGRGLYWWDQHYQQIADYEPQYNRLDELMRWSGALEWLTQSSQKLPVSANKNGNLRFAEWYRDHNELRERAPLTVVTPPSAKQEAILTTPSETFPSCGMLEIHGGVSFADGLSRGDDLPTGNAELPSGMRRAGPTDPAATHFAGGSGQVEQITRGDQGQVTSHKIIGVQRGPDVARIHISDGSTDPIPLSGNLFSSGDNDLREAIQAGDHSLVFDLLLGDAPFARESVHEIAGSGAQRQADITVQRGIEMLMQDVASRIAKDPVHGLDKDPNVNYSYGVGGLTLYRFADGWMDITDTLAENPSVKVAASEPVDTSLGTRYVEVVVPRQLSALDLAHLQRVSGKVVNGKDVSRELDAGDPEYVDMQSLAGTEQPKTLSAAISTQDQVMITVAQPTSTANVDGDTTGTAASGNRTEELFGYSFFGAVDPWGVVGTSGGGSGGGGPGGGGMSFGDLVGIGGGIVLVSVCPAPNQQRTTTQPPPTTASRKPDTMWCS